MRRSPVNLSPLPPLQPLPQQIPLLAAELASGLCKPGLAGGIDLFGGRASGRWGASPQWASLEEGNPIRGSRGWQPRLRGATGRLRASFRSSLLERSPELIAALIGVLRAGGAYAPLDPAFPPERLGWILDDLVPSSRDCGSPRGWHSEVRGRYIGLPRSQPVLPLFKVTSVGVVTIFQGNSLNPEHHRIRSRYPC
ncbi:MAG TPA: AMP-binding protein [Thermoanaerobaculia bacterium]|nr:AMP-binding protein [Thermoanaerobaculia bacterium]